METCAVDLSPHCAAAQTAVEALGGPVKAARTLSVRRYQTVQSWVRNGIPPKYVLRIEAITGISRRDLRPSDWSDYWPTAEAGL